VLPGVLSADFEHGKKLTEMALGEFGIDGEPELSARLCGENDFALRRAVAFFAQACGFLVDSILQH